MEVPSIFLNRVLTEAAKRNASSLHLTVGSLPLMRIDNSLSPIEKENIVTTELIVKIMETFMSDEEKNKLKEDKEVILVKELASGFRFRINIFYQKSLPSMSFHYISSVIRGIGELKLPKILSNVTKLNSGLFIIAGPYDSGKTTSIVAMIEEINKNYKKNIFTIEDPIEYQFVSKRSLISQRQVGRDIKTVVQGLKYCLEEDADVVYIGEIKNEFDAAIPKILELAAGNSLVLLEVNANSSIRTIEKILQSAKKNSSEEAARYSLADVLLGIVVQRLIPRVGGGLVMAIEILIASSAVKSLLREGKIYQLESIIQTSRKEGMVNMAKSLEELIRGGEIKQEDANININ